MLLAYPAKSAYLRHFSMFATKSHNYRSTVKHRKNCTLWLSVTYPRCHDYSFSICQECCHKGSRKKWSFYSLGLIVLGLRIGYTSNKECEEWHCNWVRYEEDGRSRPTLGCCMVALLCVVLCLMVWGVAAVSSCWTHSCVDMFCCVRFRIPFYLLCGVTKHCCHDTLYCCWTCGSVRLGDQPG